MRFEQLEKSEALKKAEKENAELATKLASKKYESAPRPPMVSSEIAEVYRDSLEEIEEEKTEKIIKFPERKKTPEMEEPEKRKQPNLKGPLKGSLFFFFG